VRLGREVRNKLFYGCEKIRFLTGSNVSMVSLRMMVVVQERRRFFSCADECEPVPDTLRVPGAPLNLPKDELIKVAAVVGPLPMPQ